MLHSLHNLVRITLEGRGEMQRGSMFLNDKSVALSADILHKHLQSW